MDYLVALAVVTAFAAFWVWMQRLAASSRTDSGTLSLIDRTLRADGFAFDGETHGLLRRLPHDGVAAKRRETPGGPVSPAQSGRAWTIRAVAPAAH